MSFTIGVNNGGSANPDYISETQLTENDADFDDFDDFQEASPLVNDEGTNNISSPLLIDQNKSDNPKSLTSISQAIDSIQIITTSLPSLDMIINQSFIKDFHDEHDKTNESITADLFNDKTSQSYKIWENLTNLEESTSFRLNWESSHSFQVFLRSLKIDNKNIIDNFFVSKSESSSEPEELTMSTTQPASSQPEIVPDTVPDETQNSSSPLSSPSSLTSTPSLSTSSAVLCTNSSKPVFSSDESTQVSHKTVEPSSELNQNQNTSASSVPKVNFDSNTSGLANNNTSTDEINQSTNNLLDVTFFLNNPNFMQPCSSPKATVKSNESEATTSLQSNELSAKPLSIISSSSTDPFHNLISHIQDASSMRSNTKTQSSITPSETSKIFEELPLLSFMRTKLLMFPLRDSIKD